MNPKSGMPNGLARRRSVGHSTQRGAYLQDIAKSDSRARKIFVDDGRRRVCVGTLEGDTFVKRVKPEHILRKPRAIALQDSVITELKESGCRTVKAVLDGGKTLTAPIGHFVTHGIHIDRGFGPQVALTLSQWSADNGQCSLFGGALI